MVWYLLLDLKVTGSNLRKSFSISFFKTAQQIKNLIYRIGKYHFFSKRISENLKVSQWIGFLCIPSRRLQSQGVKKTLVETLQQKILKLKALFY